MEKHKDFNLPRFFKTSSFIIILSISTILSFVIVKHNKDEVVENTMLMNNLYADIFHYEVDRHYRLTLDEHGIFMTSDGNITKPAELDKIARAFEERFKDILAIKIYDRAGIVVYSTDEDNIGEKPDSPNAFKMALGNKISSKLLKNSNLLKDITEKRNTYKPDILEIYIPIMSEVDHDFGHGNLNEIVNVIGVLEIYTDVTNKFSDVEIESYIISFYVFISMGVVFLLLYVIVKKADQIIFLKNKEIEIYNKALECSQLKIKDSIDKVIKQESFNVRIQESELLKCWEVKKCEERSCPSYKAKNLRCWEVAGTFCKGEVQGVFAKKFGDCRKCGIYQYALANKGDIIGENFNNMMALLESQHLQLEEANKKLESLIDMDVLTQIGNRRSFLKVIENIHLLSLRYNRPYSILICDIDNFKMYNDSYGHQMGDYVLIAIANKIKDSLRESDYVFRWGGEEFVVILPEQNIQDAMNVAENLRLEIQALAMEGIRAETKSKVITISIGVACITNCDEKIVTWEKVFKKADDALYKAKNDGRNRSNHIVSVLQ